MPLGPRTSVLASGLTPLFREETAALTTPEAARAWARAYVNYVAAGGMPGARLKELAFAQALTVAFAPELAGGGPALFLLALSAFWVGIPVPEQVGNVTAFVPITTNVNSPQPDTATPEQQANGLAVMISGLTLGSVKVTVPPGTVVPLL
jgi:hypothetical protein